MDIEATFMWTARVAFKTAAANNGMYLFKSSFESRGHISKKGHRPDFILLALFEFQMKGFIFLSKRNQVKTNYF